MTVYYFYLLTLILGFVIGFIGGFLFLINNKPDKKPVETSSCRQEDEDLQQNYAEVDFQYEENEELEEKNHFQKRMVDMENSWTDMNCNLDNVSQESYIAENKGKQDDAYNYIKNN